MHLKSKKGKRRDRKFKIRVQNEGTSYQMMARNDKIMIDLTVKECP